jgi:hypothetical protein
MGWYVVWRRATHERARLEPQLYFCVEATVGKVACMSARPTDDEDFTSVTDPCFLDALWHGPFKTRREAQLAVSPAE